MTLNTGGQISFFDQNNLVGAIATSSYAADTPIDVLYVFDMDAGTYDVSLDGSPLIEDEDHGITTNGIGRLIFSNAAFSSGQFILDDVNVQTATEATGVVPALPSSVGVLYAPHPNPFRHASTVSFDLIHSGFVALDVFDLSGSNIHSLIRSHLPAGSHTIQWDARDKSGESVGSGLYFVRLQTEGVQATQKLIVIE